jgi:hypothetical protein
LATKFGALRVVTLWLHLKVPLPLFSRTVSLVE